jgi:hypothetical protein
MCELDRQMKELKEKEKEKEKETNAKLKSASADQRKANSTDTISVYGVAKPVYLHSLDWGMLVYKLCDPTDSWTIDSKFTVVQATADIAEYKEYDAIAKPVVIMLKTDSAIKYPYHFKWDDSTRKLTLDQLEMHDDIYSFIYLLMK